jgi:hypothetical protein
MKLEQLSRAAMSFCCGTEFYSVVPYRPRIKVLLIAPGLLWDPLFGQGRAGKLFQFHEFFILFVLVSFKTPEIELFEGISSRLAVVPNYARTAGYTWYICDRCRSY